jgi:hypothetical protein
MEWLDEIDGLSEAYPYSPEVDLPAEAEVLRVRGFRDLSPLAGVRGVRTLWVLDARPGELARVSALTPDLETLVVGGRHVTDLDYLRGVGAPSTLVLWDHTKLERLDGIEVLGSLTSLTLDNVPRVHDLGPLAALSELRHLRLSVLMSRAMNSSDQLVDSLAPLADLRRLERLDCFCVRARDGDLSPLYALPHLEDVEIPLTYSSEQIARLAGVLGRGPDEWPAVKPTRRAPCKRCGADDEVMLVGVRRNAFVCRRCDAERVERHVAAFEAWRSDGAAVATS